MELNKFFVVILPMFFISIFFLISHEAFAQNETQKFVYEQDDPEFKKYENSILGMKFSYPEYWGNSAKPESQDPRINDCFDAWFCSDFWILDNPINDSTFHYT